MSAKIKQWWASHPLSLHAIAGLIATLTVLYEAVPAFKQLVLTIYGDMPSWSHQIVAAILGIYAFYYKSAPSKPPQG